MNQAAYNTILNLYKTARQKRDNHPAHSNPNGDHSPEEKTRYIDLCAITATYGAAVRGANSPALYEPAHDPATFRASLLFSDLHGDRQAWRKVWAYSYTGPLPIGDDNRPDDDAIFAELMQQGQESHAEPFNPAPVWESTQPGSSFADEPYIFVYTNHLVITQHGGIDA